MRQGQLVSSLVFGVAAALFFVGLTSVANAFDPYGIWIRPSTGSQVSFYDCGGKLCAKIIAVKNPNRQSEVGTIIMKGAIKAGDNEWKGDLLNTEDGKTYAGVVTLQGPNALNLKGCALGIICQGETWTRVK